MATVGNYYSNIEVTIKVIIYFSLSLPCMKLWGISRNNPLFFANYFITLNVIPVKTWVIICLPNVDVY